MEQWPSYIAGIGIGVLSWLFLLSDKTPGCSTAFARTSGMISRLPGVNAWAVVFPAAFILVLILFLLEKAGL